ncbi:MarR family transcriptional regulator, transcriptional regulator for hemolysin [Terrimicrobium sacchariphilum]|uniref:MarR family transcriptional regulator, transcriptional regulator for hemolysin n=2 Tax=Terrimicrobium sacchariphilum TaxID=690879 RepID=A0A146GAA6_TERSA|nr:MarR family transcriptional regulator, transcriptional regulator for hemolysin [Terrimicrobium sacchariphilum]
MREQTNQRAHFAKLVIQISRRWRRRVDQALANQGFTQATGLPLLILAREGQIRQGALVEELGLEGPSLVRVIDMLEADGLLRREEDPTDRRAKLLSLTEAGRNRARIIEREVDRLRRHFLEGIDEASLGETIRVLECVDHNLLKETPGGGRDE